MANGGGRGRPPSRRLSPAQDALYFVVVADGEKVQFASFGIRNKKQPEAEAASAFKNARAEFAQTDSCMTVRFAPRLEHGAEGFAHQTSLRRCEIPQVPDKAIGELNLPRVLRCCR
jgi:hypothetical protein